MNGLADLLRRGVFQDNGMAALVIYKAWQDRTDVVAIMCYLLLIKEAMQAWQEMTRTAGVIMSKET